MLSWWFKLCIFCVHWKMLLQCLLLFVLLEIKFTTTYTNKRHSSKNHIYIYKLEITNRVFTKYYWSLGASKHIAPQMVYVTNIRNITIARILPILIHYDDVIMGAIASQITNLTIVYSAVYSGANQRKYQKSASLAFVRGIHRWPVNSPHKWPVTREMFSFDDVILHQSFLCIR